MATRIPASQRTREELTALIEGRLQAVADGLFGSDGEDDGEEAEPAPVEAHSLI
jgi:hypothetical protein